MRWLLSPILLLALTAAAPSSAQSASGHHLAVVLDTSGSMGGKGGNDRPRLAIQAIKILADMLGPNDRLTLVRMPGSSKCRLQPDQSLILDTSAAGLSAFKSQLDNVDYSTATNFIVPLVTAKQVLDSSQASERLLIVISDAGSDGCLSGSNSILSKLRVAGVHTAGVSVGTGSLLSQQYDISSKARDASQLLMAIGGIFQQFLGAKAPSSGQLSAAGNRINVEIAPFVGEAFVLVAAEGPVGSISPLPGNPAAANVDSDFRSGQTRGQDKRVRGYRILRLERPNAGTWGFEVSGLSSSAGWFLIQDFSVSMRFTPPATVAQGADTPLTLELINDSTGQRIDRPGSIPGLEVSTTIDGTRFLFRDNGSGGDQQADDGVMTALVQFMTPGQAEIPLRLVSKYLQDQATYQTMVIEASWALEVQTLATTFIGDTLAVAIKPVPVGAGGVLKPPKLIRARFDTGQTMLLRDDGQDGDAQAGDGLYTRNWTPAQVGTVRIDYQAEGGSKAGDASGMVEVRGTIAFGKPGSLELGRLTSNTEGQGGLDLGFIEVTGEFPIQLSSDFSHHHSRLEIDLGQGFVELDRDRLDLTLREGTNRQWTVRLRVEGCPSAVEPDTAGVVIVEAADHQGQPLRAEVPIRVEVIKDPWMHCWWPVIAAILLAALAIFIIYGIISPARFPRSFGVVLSPEADMDEGYPFNIRSQKGSRSGFYRDARIYISTDYQLSPSPRGALARLRADRMGVFMLPLPGNAVLQLDADEEWETMSTEQETRVRFSRLYKNMAESLFFEFRNV
jgi:hypothetical protein